MVYIPGPLAQLIKNLEILMSLSTLIRHLNGSYTAHKCTFLPCLPFCHLGLSCTLLFLFSSALSACGRVFFQCCSIDTVCDAILFYLGTPCLALFLFIVFVVHAAFPVAPLFS